MLDSYAKLPDETDQWHARLIKYLQAGPNRSLRAMYTAETGNKGSIPGAWQKAVKRFNWLERAAAFDAQSAAQEIDDFEKKRQRTRENRQLLIDALMGLVAKAHIAENSRETIDLKAVKTLSEVAETIFEQARIEYGDALLKPSVVVNNTAQAN